MLSNEFLSVILAFLIAPLVGMAWTGTGRRRRAEPGWLNPVQASAVEAAVARVVTAGPEFSGNTIALPCTECGSRQIPPAEHADTPPIPVELATLVEDLSAGGWRILATCTACGFPTVSRNLDDEYAHHALSIGVVPSIDLSKILP